MATIDTNGSGISLGGDGFGGNSNVLMFLIFAMMFGGNGFFGRGGYQPQYATQDFVQNGFNFNDLQDQNRDLMNAITGGTAQSVAAAQSTTSTVSFSVMSAQSPYHRHSLWQTRTNVAARRSGQSTA